MAREHICSLSLQYVSYSSHVLGTDYMFKENLNAPRPSELVRARLHSTVSMARCGLRDAFVVWLCKSETIEDHVLYYAKVVSRYAT